MIIDTTPIEGVAVIDLELRSDDRGFFARTFCVEEFGAAGLQTVVEQCNQSFNHRAGTLRGMHFQIAPHPEAKLVRCIRGAIVDIIVDMRPDSPTRLQHVAVELTADNRRALYVPPFFAHGYQTLLDDTEVMYQVSGSYEPTAERGLRHDDPELGLEWPLPVSVISTKDSSWPLIADRDVRDYGWQPETAGARS
ncbi:MAG TPA: dTDP-4-dehydrorhamnose 3,5-epimerase [Microlunatus sp.]